MSARRIVMASVLFSLASFSAEAATVRLSRESLVKKVSTRNFKVYENALKVYQAKANIEKARADLLPKLSIWTIAKTILNPTSLIESLPEVAPFLVPANWFRVQENKLLYLAEKEGYRALWANEVHAAKLIYAQVLMDMQLLETVKLSILDLQRIHEILLFREELGGAPVGTARDMEIRILGLKEDQRNLQVLIQQEVNSLTYALGMNVRDKLELAPIAIPDVSRLGPLAYDSFEFRLLSNSPERRQYGHFLSVVDQIKNEIRYSFLGGSSISRGVAGGIFDNLPTPNGLGFGQGPAMDIVKAQRKILEAQRRGVEETLKRQLMNLTYAFNLDLEFYKDVSRRSMLAKESQEQLLTRIELGEEVNVLELSEASRNVVQANSSLLGLQYRMVSSLDRLDRLIFDKDYAIVPPVVDSLR